jgi:very-short-patch-repair endonuclease
MPVSRESARFRARLLRQESTPAEEALWELLRDRQLLGLKFRRQVPIGSYVADFYCHEMRLVLELDGEVHEGDRQKAHDINRDHNLAALGYRVLRFTNCEALEQPATILQRLKTLFQHRSQP